jgi:hypothetical protein
VDIEFFHWQLFLTNTEALLELRYLEYIVYIRQMVR